MFTKEQRTILKRWFITHAENPYLTESSKNELSQATGLDHRQISNWFTNVRKRIWQPIKRKNKHGTENLIMKVKAKLESEADSCNMSVTDQAHANANYNYQNFDNFGRQNSGGSLLQQILSKRPKRKELDLVNKFNKLDGFDISQGQELQKNVQPQFPQHHQPKILNPEILTANQNKN